MAIRKNLRMGCVKMNKTQFYKRSNQIKKTLIIPLIFVIMIAVATPMTFADHVTVTFDPSGGVDIDVNQSAANFSTVIWSSTDNYPTGFGTDTSYTVYNNGTAAAEVFICSNLTTDGGEMTLDDGGAPGADEYSIDVTGSDNQQITGSNTSWIDPLAAGGGAVTFGLNLDLGTGSTNFQWQTTRINITGAPT